MKNKGTFVIAIFIAAALLIVGGAVAHTDETEAAEGKGLVEEKVSCDELNNEQLEAIGEYLMELMHPGEAHELMHQMMAIEEDSPYHEKFHVNLAQAMYCGETPMAGMQGMMPMMMNMFGGKAMGGQDMMQSGNMMGTSQYGLGYWNFVNILYVVLLLGLTGIVYFWLIKLWKGQGKKSVMKRK